jgi:hypothetical protein
MAVISSTVDGRVIESRHTTAPDDAAEFSTTRIRS